MLVTRIGRLCDYGVFRDFTWPSDLAEFAQYNLIYGWNGSGKTMLSRVFRGLEARTAPPNGQVTVTTCGREINNDNFAQVALSVRVFNRDFVAESVFPTDCDIAPIFVLGKENVEKQLRATEGKLGNESFIARAPEKVVAAERSKLTDIQSQLARLDANLAALPQV